MQDLSRVLDPGGDLLVRQAARESLDDRANRKSRWARGAGSGGKRTAVGTMAIEQGPGGRPRAGVGLRTGPAGLVDGRTEPGVRGKFR